MYSPRNRVHHRSRFFGVVLTWRAEAFERRIASQLRRRDRKASRRNAQVAG